MNKTAAANRSLPLTDPEELLQRIRRQGRNGELEAKRTPRCVITPESASEAVRWLRMAVSHVSPGCRAALAVAENAIIAEMGKPLPEERASLVTWLIDNYYLPKDSIRVAANKIHIAAKEINLSEDYPSEPQRSIKRIMQFNGGRVPSSETIRKDY